MTTSPIYPGTQVVMNLGPKDRSDSARTRLMALRAAAVSRLSIKEVAFALDVAPTYLGDALAGRERKGWKAEWDPTLFAMLTDDEAQDWMEILSDIRRPPTPEEELSRVRRAGRARVGAVVWDEIEREARK